MIFEKFKMALNAYPDHLAELKHGMQDAERRFLADEYMMEAYIKILEHRARVGSAPAIDPKKLIDMYLDDFCRRVSTDKAIYVEVLEIVLSDLQNNSFYGNDPKPTKIRNKLDLRYSALK